MAKGIFTLECLEAVEPIESINEIDYIDAQSSLDNNYNEIESLHEVYNDANQDGEVILGIANSLPDTDDAPVESTIIATEALIRKLGLPNYSLESYKQSTNKALKLSLEETVEKTNEAKKSLFKKIWEKIVAFLKKAYEFFTGLFKKKTKDVKRKVDDLKVNDAEEGIKKAEETKHVDIDEIYKKLKIVKKDGKLCISGSRWDFNDLYINQKELITVPKIEHVLTDLEEDFKNIVSNVNKLNSNLTINEINEISKEIKSHLDKPWDDEKYNNPDEDDIEDGRFYLELASKNELEKLISKIDVFNGEIANTQKKMIDIVNTKWKISNLEELLDEKKEIINKEILRIDSEVAQKIIRRFMFGVRTYKDFSKSAIKYVESITNILEKIEHLSK